MLIWDESISAPLTPGPTAPAQGRPVSARLVVTDRHDGVSRPPYDGLNLGGHVGDDPDDVEANRWRLAAELGVARDHLLFMDQVHGSDVVVVDGPWEGAPPPADGLVTRTAGLALAVLVADCVPVLLADPAAGVVGVAHAGRPGMAAGVAVRLLEAVRDLGGRDVVGRIGPSVCARCYEVPEAMREDVGRVAPLSRSVSWRGTPAIDVAAGVLDQLASRGVAVEQLPGCTAERSDLYSYRRDGTTGRFAGAALLTSTGAA